MKNKKIAQSGLIAAIYVLCSILLAPISFGIFQFRIAEALTILPAVLPQAVLGVTVGCLITNTWGVVMGFDILGVLDIVLGTMATFLSAVMTKKIKKIPFCAIPPILINALVIGLELTVIETGTLSLKLLLINMGKLAIEEGVCTLILGIPVMKVFKNALQNTTEK